MVIRRASCLLLATAATSFAACGSDEQAPVAQPADAGTPDAPAPEGCVDIRVDGRLLGGEHRGPATLGNDPFWLDDRGIHIVWHATEPRGDGKLRAHLVVSTFDPSKGELQEQLVLGAFPPEMESMLGGILASGGAPDGAFVVAFDTNTSISDVPVTTVAAYEPGGPDPVATWSPPWSRWTGGILNAAWDGEAFAIDGCDGEHLLVARLGVDGSEVLPAVPFAPIGTISDDYYYDIQTDPDTGETWGVSAGGKGVWVKGHLRDGTPLPGVSPESSVFVQGEGLEWKRMGLFPSAVRGTAGALLSWDDGYYGTILQLLDASVVPVAPAVVIPPDQATMESPAYYAERRTLCAAGYGWWSAMANRKTVDSYVIAVNLDVRREPLIAHSASSCAETDTCDGGTTALDVRKFSAVRWNDELWFGFHDYSDQKLDDEHRQYVEPYRIVRIKPGCVYPSMYDVGMGLAQ